jgi:hypothetical protein
MAGESGLKMATKNINTSETPSSLVGSKCLRASELAQRGNHSDRLPDHLFNNLIIVHVAVPPKEHILKFDVDDCGHYGWGSPLINDLLEDLLVVIRSLQTQFPQIGKVVLKRTMNGFHVKFPDSHMPFWLVKYLTQKFPHDFGQLWWSSQHGRVTLRMNEKPVVKTVSGEHSKRLGLQIIHDKPQTIRILYPDGKIMCRKEIEEKYGDV